MRKGNYFKSRQIKPTAKEFVYEVTEADPENDMRFYRRLARMLGNNRLIYSSSLDAATTHDIPSTHAEGRHSESRPE